MITSGLGNYGPLVYVQGAARCVCERGDGQRGGVWWAKLVKKLECTIEGWMRAEEGSAKFLKIPQVAKEITRCARNLWNFGSHRFIPLL